MKLSLGLCVAAALALATLPSTEARLDVDVSADKFFRRDVTTDTPTSVDPAKVAELSAKGTNDPGMVGAEVGPLFGTNIVDQYLKNGGKGVPPSGKIADRYQNCKWRRNTTNDGLSYWGDEFGVQCMLIPSYKYHAFSPAQMFDPAPGACVGEPTRPGYPGNGEFPKYSISVPSLYFQNNYLRQCNVRALVKIPKTKDHEEKWVVAFVTEHDGGNWVAKLGSVEHGAQVGILLSEDLYKEFYNKDTPRPGTLPCEVEWFFPDLNVL
ncbi:hypothetical protein BCV70DRAFT_199726 [Testicularia cyperi]|uniref:Uncharacterized protein n=1 Tax=Testicularia cyperi TaxID=1882483 RepID=A0A317XSX5_9BASI|nr:hypothetical protein BCV70DRAFT_199726 [Testicularia cyperi]